LEWERLVSVPEIRQAAYSIVASAMCGGPPPDRDILGTALDIVLADERKSRTAGERAIQQYVSVTLAVSIFTDRRFVKRVKTVGDTVSGALTAAMGEEPS
jgi:hypothetical protein